ncbi:hypothetical protein N0824_02453 [Microcystis sp. 0824]|uniref:Uncharacterized protein n=1 Tax=Microcystis aeruginosa NIES-2519 TaxID=2303981 RepID=A0A5A5R486_MICAE|nr:hypothetical protein N0824_02453 [Microcystis sp. 0824]GBL16730.1 hypothetical protein MTo_04054 [Microcystis aeruginosa NIES-1211]GCA69495.1 hypothetical protein MiYa_01021 [Microcystis aeruginosa NIES-2519]GCA82481.1 hypothetical protein MiHa_00432 [Microcystis aeruginosa NIES-2522]GCA89911.1 hypothetical protein MiTa_03265 [Microcystis aeruginosa NIES-4264]
MINFCLLNIYKNLGRQGLPDHDYLLGGLEAEGLRSMT